MCDLQIECLVRSLGIGATYRGYRYLNYGIKLCIYDENYLLGINKLLYPQIAREFKATCQRRAGYTYCCQGLLGSRKSSLPTGDCSLSAPV